jgi:hypothetical protein
LEKSPSEVHRAVSVQKKKGMTLSAQKLKMRRVALSHAAAVSEAEGRHVQTKSD